MSASAEIHPGEIEVLIEAMKSIGGGELTRQAAENLQKAVKATYLNDKKSSISIVIEITKSNDEIVTLTGSTKATLPANKISGAFFVNQKTFLPTRNRPDQTVMVFKD
ncbi:hypothetical protein AAHK07_09275 [Aliarcobacter cryaerophilus]|uniref:hypothetical protein n=1 Tax=Aliarcobacter cryaerophilus TaxID=28198 RepID=UPI00112F08AA|nr:hypothetical protein [Aliarcobacter cryaerophilus]MCT7489101.1 hypothetical protein [Aliarcobacter cryaerophilus]QNK85927.1 hypothetical protein HOO31_04790 [Aliarcobacter cryaerophilus]